MSAFATIANSVVALVVILLDATFFTNPAEILDGRLATQQEAVGSLLTTVGIAALPESVIAAVAILELDVKGGEIIRGTDTGIGAILGTPFVLATLALIFQSTIHVTFGLHFIPLEIRRAGPLRCDTGPHFGWADVPCDGGSGKLRAIHLVIGGAFYLAFVLGGGPGRCLMGGAERRQR